MCLREYHRDSVTCLLQVLLAEYPNTGCCIATRSQLRSQVRIYARRLGLHIHLQLPVVIVCDRWLLLPAGVVWRKVFCGTFIWGQGRQLSQGAAEGIPCFFERHWYGELRFFFRSAS